MKAIEKALKKQLILAIVFSCMLVAGVPMIVFGAINMGGLTILMVAGIVFVVLGFYGTPLVWISYGNKVSLKRVVYAVDREHLLTVQEISAQLSISR